MAMEDSVSDTDNVELVKMAFERINRRDLANIGELVSPDAVRHDLSNAYPEVTGEGIPDFLAELLRGAPDLKLNIQDAFSAGDRVTVRFTLDGTHEGPLLGVAGTGKRFSINQINIYRMEGGQVVETWQLPDLAGFLKQIGE